MLTPRFSAGLPAPPHLIMPRLSDARHHGCPMPDADADALPLFHVIFVHAIADADAVRYC
jgi:hypothetical protein